MQQATSIKYADRWGVRIQAPTNSKTSYKPALRTTPPTTHVPWNTCWLNGGSRNATRAAWIVDHGSRLSASDGPEGERIYKRRMRRQVRWQWQDTITHRDMTNYGVRSYALAEEISTRREKILQCLKSTPMRPKSLQQHCYQQLCDK